MPDRKLIDECVHCGFCLPSCPTYRSGGEEMDSPRGRIYLMKVGITPEVVKHIDRCLGCLACVPACPSGVKYGTLIEQTRAEIEATHRRTLGERLLRAFLFALLPFPRRLKLLLPLQMLGRAVGFPRRLISLLPPLSLAHLRARLPAESPAAGPRRARVALLAGCVQRVYFPSVNEATVRVLNAEGVDVVIPRDLGCCGALSMHAGRAAEAHRFQERATRAALRAGVDAVIANAAGCGSWLKEGPLAARTRDVSEFLVELGPAAARHPLPARVAYHDACHLANAQGIRAQPRALLRAIPGLELVELPDGDACCGSAGVYNLLQPESARVIGERKVADVLSVAPEILVSGNPGCTLQLQSLLRERGMTLRVAHPIELLDTSIRQGVITH